MTYYEIVRMVANACVKCFRNGTGGCQETVVQCATQIYIAQMNKNEERAE